MDDVVKCKRAIEKIKIVSSDIEKLQSEMEKLKNDLKDNLNIDGDAYDTVNLGSIETTLKEVGDTLDYNILPSLKRYMDDKN